MEERRTTKPTTKPESHNLIMENRRKLSVSGVEEVESFDEESIILLTQMGKLTIKGDGLHINKLSVESGEVVIEGNLDSCAYSVIDNSVKGGGLFRRMFQ